MCPGQFVYPERPPVRPGGWSSPGHPSACSSSSPSFELTGALPLLALLPPCLLVLCFVFLFFSPRAPHFRNNCFHPKSLAVGPNEAFLPQRCLKEGWLCLLEKQTSQKSCAHTPPPPSTTTHSTLDSSPTILHAGELCVCGAGGPGAQGGTPGMVAMPPSLLRPTFVLLRI